MKKTANEYIRDWISETPFQIDMSLINELKEYSDDTVLRHKVMRVYRKCIKQRHIALADKIESKYRQYFPKSDLIMAMAYSLIASKQQDNEER